MGEIDLIVEREGMIHFVEVKTRRSTAFGYPEESVTRKKQEKLRRTVEGYLAASRHTITRYQIDVLAIIVLHGAEPAFHYVEAIF